jgi:hypothetical protein
MHNVRGRDELEIILNKTGKEDEEKYMRLARIDLALRYQEKPVSSNIYRLTVIPFVYILFSFLKFVSHSNCQQKLVEIWYSGIRNLSKMNSVIQALLFLVFLPALPFMCIVYIVAPKSKVNTSNINPHPHKNPKL